MTGSSFDPDAPLPGAPDPWAGTDTPLRRAGPPSQVKDATT